MSEKCNAKAKEPLTPKGKEAKKKSEELLLLIFGPSTIEIVENRKKYASEADLQCNIPFSELSSEARRELKQRMFQERLIAKGQFTNVEILYDADEYISDNDLAERYHDELFCKADFRESCFLDESDECEQLDDDISESSLNTDVTSEKIRDRRVTELTRDELYELKQILIDERDEALGEGTSWDELANADDYISDEEVFERYRDTTFCSDDFFCNSLYEDN